MQPEAGANQVFDEMIAEIFEIIEHYETQGADRCVLVFNVWGCLNFALFDLGWTAHDLMKQIAEDNAYHERDDDQAKRRRLV